jgi:hypothetical protein
MSWSGQDSRLGQDSRSGVRTVGQGSGQTVGPGQMVGSVGRVRTDELVESGQTFGSGQVRACQDRRPGARTGGLKVGSVGSPRACLRIPVKPQTSNLKPQQPTTTCQSANTSDQSPYEDNVGHHDGQKVLPGQSWATLTMSCRTMDVVETAREARDDSESSSR